ncbi:MAG: pseudouridine synthase [Thermodesulfobacteriota bacterium]
MSEVVRLQKYLASCGIASRRKAEELIQEGRVSVDGKTVTSMGFKVDSARQKVHFDNKLVKPQASHTYILLNKPAGYVTTLSDPQNRRIVTELIGDEIKARLFPVGRLDLNTKGALILTDDGNLAQKIQHPSFEVKKSYQALVKGLVSRKKLDRLARGIVLDGRRTAPARLSIIQESRTTTLVRITIHEGKKRQVRKMFGAIGHPVIELTRIAYGSLYLDDLAEGSYRVLGDKDLAKIFSNKFPLQKKK